MPTARICNARTAEIYSLLNNREIISSGKRVKQSTIGTRRTNAYLYAVEIVYVNSFSFFSALYFAIRGAKTILMGLIKNKRSNEIGSATAYKPTSCVVVKYVSISISV